jgi:hypothetical protein
MPSLSLNVGLNNGRKLPFGGGAAPSNIPLSQANISMTGFSYTSPSFTDYPFSLISRSAILARQNDAFWYLDYNDPSNPTGYDILLTFQGGMWKISVRYFDPDFIDLAATNPAPNTSIPVTGWVLEAGAGNSGSVTITAA